MNKFNKTVLVIHAHPDDTEAYCGGTLTLMKDAGYRIIISTITAGGLGGVGMDAEETCTRRKREAEEAAAVLDAEYHCLDENDGFVFDTPEIRLKTLELIRRAKAGVVMTHLPMDYHSDHRTTAAIVDAATMICSLENVVTNSPPLEITPVLYHTTPFTMNDPIGTPMPAPHFFIDVTTVAETKKKMLAFHESQRELMRHMHKMDNFFEVIRQNDAERGKTVGVSYAECFWQRVGGGYQKDAVLQNALGSFIRTHGGGDVTSRRPGENHA